MIYIIKASNRKSVFYFYYVWIVLGVIHFIKFINNAGLKSLFTFRERVILHRFSGFKLPGPAPMTSISGSSLPVETQPDQKRTDYRRLMVPLWKWPRQHS